MSSMVKRTVGVLVAAAAAYWVTLPPERLVLGQDCRPAEMQAQLSAFVYRKSFWADQQTAIDQALRAQVALRAENERQRIRSAGERSDIEQKMTRLSDREEGGDEQAAMLAQREQIARIAWLTRCRQVIGQTSGR